MGRDELDGALWRDRGVDGRLVGGEIGNGRWGMRIGNTEIIKVNNRKDGETDT